MDVWVRMTVEPPPTELKVVTFLLLLLPELLDLSSVLEDDDEDGPEVILEELSLVLEELLWLVDAGTLDRLELEYREEELWLEEAELVEGVYELDELGDE